MKKTLLIASLLAGGFLFTSYQGVRAANAVEVTHTTQSPTIFAAKMNAFMQRTRNNIVEAPVIEEVVAPVFTCSYGHENCNENHRECVQGHVDCTVDHSTCEQAYTNTRGTHQGQGRNHGRHQGNNHHR